MQTLDNLFKRPGGERKTQYDLLGWLQEPQDIQLKARLDNPYTAAALHLIAMDLAGQSPGGAAVQRALIRQQRGYVGLDPKEVDENYVVSPADYLQYYLTDGFIFSVSQYGLSRVETLKGAVGASGGPYDKIAAELAATGALTK